MKTSKPVYKDEKNTKNTKTNRQDRWRERL